MGTILQADGLIKTFSTRTLFSGISFKVNEGDRIGIIGICGWGGMAINAAAIDTRIKATVAVTMYDMTRVTANGYNDYQKMWDSGVHINCFYE